MARPKEIKDAKRISVVISDKQLKQIEKMSNHIGTQENRKVTVSEAIRLAIEAVYPLPKQFDMFEGRK